MFSTSEQELIQIVDDVASAAVSISQGQQNYDSFIRARQTCITRLQEHFEKKREVSRMIEQLYKLL